VVRGVARDFARSRPWLDEGAVRWWLVAETYALVKRLWPSIAAIALELLKRKTINGEQATAAYEAGQRWRVSDVAA
jgi:hypothetical protein